MVRVVWLKPPTFVRYRPAAAARPTVAPGRRSPRPPTRRAKDETADAQFAENLRVKEALLAKAEALLPVKNVKAAKRALRPIQDAWEEAGRLSGKFFKA